MTAAVFIMFGAACVTGMAVGFLAACWWVWNGGRFRRK